VFYLGSPFFDDHGSWRPGFSQSNANALEFQLPSKLESDMLRLLIVLAVLLTTRTADAQSSPPMTLGTVSVVATSSPRFRVFPGVSVSPRPSAVRVYADNRFAGSDLETLFGDAIMSALVGQGYQRAAEGEGSYEVGFVVAMSGALSKEQLIEELGFSPGLSGSGGNQVEHGTLAVMLFKPGTDKIMWRGAIQAFVDFDADSQRRAQRIKLAARRLLRVIKQPPN
jgi:hypothetical protein